MQHIRRREQRRKVTRNRDGVPVRKFFYRVVCSCGATTKWWRSSDAADLEAGRHTAANQYSLDV